MATTTTPWTLADVADGGGPPGLWEIIEGELVEVPPAGETHGRMGSNILGMLWQHNQREKTGLIFGSDTGFILQAEPLVLRVPDVAFVSNERLATNIGGSGYLRVAPDLVAEVISPSDRPLGVLPKVVMWLEHDVRLVWVVDPTQQTVIVYAADAPPKTLTGADTLTGGEVLPQLAIPVAAIFAR